jgi:hypothetical protein
MVLRCAEAGFIAQGFAPAQAQRCLKQLKPYRTQTEHTHRIKRILNFHDTKMNALWPGRLGTPEAAFVFF